MNRLEHHWADLGREEIRRHQAAALREFLSRKVVPHSAYYRALFDNQKLNPARFRQLEDLSHIPFVSKADFLPDSANPQRAREFVLIPDRARLKRDPALILRTVATGPRRVREAVEREFRPVFLTSTTGRSSEPIPFVYTRHDLDNLASAGRRLVAVLGADRDFRIINMFPYAPHLAFWQTYYACLEFGVFNVSSGGGKVMGTDGNIRLMERVKPTAVIGMPTFLYHLMSQALEEGRQFPELKSLVLGGEKVPDGMRRKLVDLAVKLGAHDPYVVATYGFTEAKMAWGECPSPAGHGPGGYHLYPDLGIVEIVDPASGRPLPDGEPGEIVFTPLDARGTVPLRYRTGDIIDGGLVYEPCPYCGRKMPRLVGTISRQSEVRELKLDKIKGTLVDFNTLEHVLDDMPEIGAWQLELRKVNDDPLDLDEVILHVEFRGRRVPRDLADRIRSSMASRTELSPNRIEFHSGAEMRRRQGVGTELKEVRLLDCRPAELASGQTPRGSRLRHRLSSRRNGRQESRRRRGLHRRGKEGIS